MFIRKSIEMSLGKSVAARTLEIPQVFSAERVFELHKRASGGKVVNASNRDPTTLVASISVKFNQRELFMSYRLCGRLCTE
jgi:hypothetical protein